MELRRLVARVRDRIAIASGSTAREVVERWNEVKNGAALARALPSAPWDFRRQTGGHGLPFRSTIAPREGEAVIVSVLGSLGEFAEVIDISPADGRLVVAAMDRTATENEQ